MHKIAQVAEALPGRPGIATVGLTASAHGEIACPVTPGEDVTSEFACAVEVIRVFATAVEHGRPLQPGMTLGYGPSGVRVSRIDVPPGWIIEELAEPTRDSADPWIPGVARVAALMDAGLQALGVLAVDGPPSFPSIRSMVVSCDRADVLGRFAMERAEPLPPRPSGDVDSGWRLYCLDVAHDHESSDVTLLPIVHLTAHRPALVPFLGTPVGTTVVFEGDDIVVFLAGADEGRSARQMLDWQPPWWSAAV